MKQRSLQVRFVYSFILMAFISILLVGILTLGISLRIFNNREEEYLNRIADEAAGQLEQYYRVDVPQKELNEALSRFGLRNNVALRIDNPEGDTLSESFALSENPGLGLTTASSFPLMPVARKTLDFEPLTGYTLDVLRFDEYFFHPVSLLVEGMLLATLGAIAAAIFIGRYIGRRFARPIIRLSGFATEISARRWDEELPETNSAELEELTHSLDSMRRQLAASFHALEEERDIMKRFLQDASHQLRTPVTALTTFLELMSMPSVVDKREELLEDSRQQVDKLSRIISDLMELTRIESERIKEVFVECSLKDLARKAWKGLQEKAREKKLFFDISGPSGIVRGDPHRLEMALSNILDNGVKWSPVGGRIIIRLTRVGAKVVIRISDQGPGIRPDDLDRIFERFYQSTAHSAEGSGLGLAVVKRIVENSGGIVSAGVGIDGGAWFEISLQGVQEGK